MTEVTQLLRGRTPSLHVQNSGMGGIFTPIWQMRKLRLMLQKGLVSNHVAMRGGIQAPQHPDQSPAGSRVCLPVLSMKRQVSPGWETPTRRYSKAQVQDSERVRVLSQFLLSPYVHTGLGGKHVLTVLVYCAG